MISHTGNISVSLNIHVGCFFDSAYVHSIFDEGLAIFINLDILVSVYHDFWQS